MRPKVAATVSALGLVATAAAGAATGRVCAVCSTLQRRQRHADDRQRSRGRTLHLVWSASSNQRLVHNSAQHSIIPKSRAARARPETTRALDLSRIETRKSTLLSLMASACLCSHDHKSGKRAATGGRLRVLSVPTWMIMSRGALPSERYHTCYSQYERASVCDWQTSVLQAYTRVADKHTLQGSRVETAASPTCCSSCPRSSCSGRSGSGRFVLLVTGFLPTATHVYSVARVLCATTRSRPQGTSWGGQSFEN